MPVQDETSQDISNQIKNAGSNVGRAATNKLTKKAQQVGKQAAKKAAKAAFQIAKQAITIIINFLGTLFGPVGIGIMLLIFFISIFPWLLDQIQVDNQMYQNEAGTSSGRYTAANTLAAVFYEKYSDQSFYYVLSLPEEKNDEEYSGKTYEELGGKPETTGIQQASQTNYLEDVDGYEDAVKLSAGMLSVLDTKLNKAGTTGYYYPEQFIKLLAIDYSSDSCRLTSETDEEGNTKNVEISGCKLKNLLTFKEEESSEAPEETEKVYEEAEGTCYFEASLGWHSDDDPSYNCSTDEWKSKVGEKGTTLVTYNCVIKKDEINYYAVAEDGSSKDCSNSGAQTQINAFFSTEAERQMVLDTFVSAGTAYPVTMEVSVDSTPQEGSSYKFAYQKEVIDETADETEVLSVKYEKANGIYQKTSEKELSTSDYGLGSLVQYEAHYQPSRINNYKILDTTIVDNEWNYGDSGTPYKVVNFSSLSSDEQKEIINKYKNLNASNTSEYTKSSVQKSSSNNEGLVATGETGLYPVEDEIVYKEWKKISDYSDVSEWEQWGKSEPLVSTGVLDTEIVYAISKAVVYFQETPITFQVTETWTDLDTAVHEQSATYIKDYQLDEATKKLCSGKNNCSYTIASYDSAQALKKMYNADGTFIGYAFESPKWIDGYIDGTLSESNTGGTHKEAMTYSEKMSYCNSLYDANTPAQKTQYQSCLNRTQYKDVTTYTSTYSYHYIPGHWEVTLVRDTSGNEINETVTLKDNSDKEVNCNITKTGDSEDVYGTAKSECKNNNQGKYVEQNDRDPQNASIRNKYKNDSAWSYTPSYLFSISAHAEGQLQVRLVSHGRNNLTSSEESFNYLTGYIMNYETYIPSQSPTYICTSDINSEVFNTQQPYSSISKCNCTATSPYCLAATKEGQTYMTEFGINNMTEIQADYISEVLGLKDKVDTSEIKYTEESVEIPSNVNTSIKASLAKTATDYGKAIEKASKKYGINATLLKSMITVANSDSIGLVECDGSCTYEDIFIFDEVSSGKRTVRDVTLITEGEKEEVVGSMAAKLQRLMEKNDGNLLITLLEYNLGEETMNAVLEVYATASGFPLEEIKEDKYDTGWYHYISEVLDNTTKYGVSPLSTATKTYIQDIITYLGSSSTVSWTRKPVKAAEGITSEYFGDSSTKVFIWQKSELYDRVSTSTIKKNMYDSNIITALYNMKKYDGIKYRTYWKLLTANQKGSIKEVTNLDGTTSYYVEDAYYINDDGEYDRTLRLPSSAIKIAYSSSKSVARNIMRMALAFDSEETMSEQEILSPDYWLSKFGNMKVKPDYTKIVGRSLEAPAEEYTTVKTAGEAAGTRFGASTKTAWIIRTDEGADIVSITATGKVVSASGSTVDVYLSDLDTTIRYVGLDEIAVKEDDDISKLSLQGSDGKNKKLLGKSKGDVSIFVYHDGGYYDMEDFLKSATSSLSIGSGIVTGYLGGACLSYEESMQLWAIINEDRSTDGGAKFNCTRFTNYMISAIWGSDFFAPVYGNGYDKVDNIVAAFSDKGVVKKTVSELNDHEENMAFSYSDGSYGHTGWINEFVKDSSMEGGGYVIVSEGNVGSQSLIRLNQKYTYDEWYEKVGQHCTFAVRS